MKLIQETLRLPGQQSFKAVKVTVPHFRIPWHYHQEYEFVHIIQGHGVRHIGETRLPFHPGDTVLIGPDLPHVWINDGEYFNPESKLVTEALVLQFHPDLAGILSRVPEFTLAAELLKNSGRGLNFPVGSEIPALFQALQDQTPLNRFTAFLHFLQYLASLESQRICDTPIPEDPGGSGPKMKVARQFFLNNYTRKITLDEAARQVSMSTEAFCRFYRRESGETMTQTLNRLRIHYAAQLLDQGDLSIPQCAFEAGFDTLGYFYRIFRKIKGVTPGEYRQSPHKQ